MESARVAQPAELLRRLASPVAAAAPSSARPQPGRQTHCGDLGIRIARDGTWFYHGSPIHRKPLVRLFSTVLRRDEAGDFLLETPAERGRIVVDDAPFVAVAVEADGTGEARTLTFTTNVDDRVRADREHPIRVVEDQFTGEPAPYVMVRDGLEARIARAVFYELVDYGVPVVAPGGPRLGLWSAGVRFDLGALE